jgi:hypothetical protein
MVEPVEHEAFLRRGELGEVLGGRGERHGSSSGRGVLSVGPAL